MNQKRSDRSLSFRTTSASSKFLRCVRHDEVKLAVECHQRVNIAAEIALRGPIDDAGEIFLYAVVSSRRGKSSAIDFIDQAHVDHLHHVLQDHRLDDHTLARNDLDHFFKHQSIDSLVDGRPS